MELPRYLVCLFKRSGKGLDTGKALLRVFGKCLQHDLLDDGRDCWNLLSQEGRRSREVPRDDLPLGALKGADPTEPFVHDNSQGILVTGWLWLALNLFWCHIGDSARHLLCPQGAFTMSNDCDPEITEQDLLVAPQKYILRLHVPINQPRLMGVL